MRSCVFLGCSDQVMMLDGGSVSVLWASCDPAEGWEKYKRRSAVASLEILLHAIYYLSPQTNLSTHDRRCDHQTPQEQRAYVKACEKTATRPRRACRILRGQRAHAKACEETRDGAMSPAYVICRAAWSSQGRILTVRVYQFCILCP